ncbi:Tbingi protein, partial [Trypanosoma theileri]
MREMDIPPHIIRWSASFLKGRQAKVRVNSKSSPLMLFHRGVPQGTVLGPLMFIIVMNTLSKRLSQVPLLFHGFFADDLTLAVRHVNRDIINSTLQQGLNVVDEWSTNYFMDINVDKTKYTLFGTTNPHPLSL